MDDLYEESSRTLREIQTVVSEMNEQVVSSSLLLYAPNFAPIFFIFANFATTDAGDGRRVGTVAAADGLSAKAAGRRAFPSDGSGGQDGHFGGSPDHHNGPRKIINNFYKDLYFFIINIIIISVVSIKIQFNCVIFQLAALKDTVGRLESAGKMAKDGQQNIMKTCEETRSYDPSLPSGFYVTCQFRSERKVRRSCWLL